LVGLGVGVGANTVTLIPKKHSIVGVGVWVLVGVLVTVLGGVNV
jgi:hypothetical protein